MLGNQLANNYTFTDMNTNSNKNFDVLKKDFDISNLNFKSLTNLHGKNKTLNSFTLPNDHHARESTATFNENAKSNTNRQFRSYSQNQLSETKNTQKKQFYTTHNFLNNNNHIKEDFQSQPEYENVTDVHSLKIIINNLENEVRDKKTEIKILIKNFKEKVTLIETENKKSLEQLEIEYKLQINKNQQINKQLMREFKEEQSMFGLRYEELLNKILKDINHYKQNSIPLLQHNEKVKEVSFIYKENVEKMRSIFNDKMKEITSHFRTPEYVCLLNRINYFHTHLDKLKEILKITKEVDLKDYQHFISLKEFDMSDFRAYFDKLSLKICEADSVFVKEISKIIINYENISLNLNTNKNDTYEHLKEIVKKRYSAIEKMYNYPEDKKDKNNLNNYDNEYNEDLINLFSINAGLGTGTNLGLTKHKISNVNYEKLYNNSNNINIYKINPLKGVLQGREASDEKVIQGLNEIKIGKENFNTFKNESMDKIEGENVNVNEFIFSENKSQHNRDQSESLKQEYSASQFKDQEIVLKKKISLVSSELSDFVIDNDEGNIRRPSKVLNKQHNLRDYNDD